MANIITIIRKEAEKGNTLMDTKGNFINPQKLENTMRKSYLAGLKNGSVSFADYQREAIKKSFVNTKEVETILTAFVDIEEPKLSMPEPQESVAQ